MEALYGEHLNPLTSCAAPLLRLMWQIRHVSNQVDPASLRASLVEGVKQFEQHARARGVANEQVLAARYILCTALDEAAANTPWGGQGVWGKHSLLVQFHNETWGGEKVFQFLARFAENPAGNLDILELMFCVLALGFEGRYGVQDNGKAQLESLKERLAQLIQRQRGALEPELSTHWRGVDTAHMKRRLIVPLWVIASLVGALLALLFVGLLFALNGNSDPVFSSINALRARQGTTVVQLPAPAQPRLAHFLEPEIKAGLVAVRDEADRSVIIIRGDGFFAPGSADVIDTVRPLLGRIGQALNTVPGKVLIVGHTDNQPIRSLRFPSNFHLSQSRAQTVQGLLESVGVDGKRLSAEGRADAEPVGSNATPQERAKNRRVELTLFADRTAQMKPVNSEK